MSRALESPQAYTDSNLHLTPHHIAKAILKAVEG